jgi:superfamily I DNA/RNA helicase
MIKEFKRDESADYLLVLKALNEIPFPVGKNLLIDFLTGDYKNSSVKKNNLDDLHNFGTLNDKDKTREIIDNLIANNLIEISSPLSNQFAKVLSITSKGTEELINPSLNKKKLANNFIFKETIITEQDIAAFNELDFFLNKFNPEQKKAIISDKKNILCIAGAGSGKTSVLTKRIEFLVKFKGIPPEKILAITFTKKARQEMSERLSELGIIPQIETFNSFCEQILRKHSSRIYSRPVRILNYSDKIMAIVSALEHIGLDIDSATERYFENKKKEDERPNIFMNDCFFILDYFKSKNQELFDFSQDGRHKENARMIYRVCKYLQEYMKIQGLRDFTDQMLDAMEFLKKNQQSIPQFEHILVDEYQDVNSTQIELLDLLNPKNFFAVGDPRQSIYGWRGSDIKYILRFEEKFPDSDIISLKKNYRSSKKIVDLMNSSIRKMRLPDLHPHHDYETQIKLLNFEAEQDEFNFVINKILSSQIPRDEIFVLARTNRQLSDLSKLMKQKSISHVVKTEEVNKPVFAKKGDVTLATVHAIKGLEAKMVFVIGCTEQNFPCKASDHPVIEMVKIEEYDKEEEEKRLFYVAISRAKEKLFLTYTGKKHTYFINDEMIKIINQSTSSASSSVSCSSKPFSFSSSISESSS